MGKLLGFLDGNKTYLLAIVGAVLGILQGAGIEVPEWALVVLGSMGVATMRRAIETK